MTTLLTIKQFAAKHLAFSEAGLRHHVFNEKFNGMHMCIRRVGRRVFILEEAFFQWVEQQNKH